MSEAITTIDSEPSGDILHPAQHSYDTFMEQMHAYYTSVMDDENFCGFVLEEEREKESGKLLAFRAIVCDDIGGTQAKRVK